MTPLITASVACHLAALGAFLLAPRHRRAAASAVAVNNLVLSVAGCFPHRPWLGPVVTDFQAAAARAEGAGNIPDIALTFDDGPDPDVTPRVAEMLEARGLRASFFMIGERIERHQQLVRDLHAAGHRIENHTYSHAVSFAFSFLPRLAREIGGCQKTISEVTGRTPKYFRAPAGMRNPLLECALARQGLPLISWTKRGFDTVDGDADRIFERLTCGLDTGDILLLHDGNAARTAAGQPVVLEVLPRLLDHIEAAGLKAGPLPELT